MEIKTKYNIGDKVRDRISGAEGDIVSIHVQITDGAFAEKVKWDKFFILYHVEDESAECGFRTTDEYSAELIEKAK